MRFLIVACVIATESLFAQWTVHFAHENVYTIHVQDGSLFIPIYDHSVQTYFYRSHDDGVTWDSLGGGIWRFIDQMQNIGDTLYAASNWICNENCYGPALFRSYARGSAPWQAIYECRYGVRSLVAHNGILFMEDSNQIYRSANGGASWEVVSTAPSSLALSSFDGVLYSNALFKSTDNGNTWTSIRGNLFTTYVYDLEKNDTFLFACKDSVFRSADGGQSWEPVNAGLPPNPRPGYQHLTVENNNIAFTDERSVFFTANNGEHWTDVTEGLPSPRPSSIYRILIKNNYLFLTGKGIWRCPVSHLVAVKDRDGDIAPASYRLEQNYPNPFNPATVLQYQIPEPAHVTLKIYSIIGQEVRALVDRVQGAGIYAATWDGKDGTGRAVPAGLYFYRIEAGEYTQVKKMALLR